jgi:cytochrome c-type biogenesis protein CcmE
MRRQSTFIVAGILILAAVVVLIISNTGSAAHYFLTIEELNAMDEQALTRDVTVSGAVLGETIAYDAMRSRLSFTIVHIPADPQAIKRAGGLSQVLHKAGQDPEAPQLDILYEGAKPDLLRDEAQAIVRGRLQADGTFYAEELNLKCPSRYAEDIPEQAGQ